MFENVVVREIYQPEPCRFFIPKFFGLYCITFRHITTRASKQASEVYDQDRAVLDAWLDV